MMSPFSALSFFCELAFWVAPHLMLCVSVFKDPQSTVSEGNILL